MSKTPEEKLAANRKWKAEKKDRVSDYKKLWNKENKDHVSRYNEKHYQRDPEKQRVRAKKYNREERLKAISEYGGKCVCCGDRTYEFLTFDHINNDGAAHRKEIGDPQGKSMVAWLKRNNYPKDIIQLLCFNCNHAKAKYGTCPHGGV